jgi:FtsH-binding integral membrane protein
MSQPVNTPTNASSDPRQARLVRSAIWVAIGALIAAALVSVVWVLVGAQNGLVGRAFLTILLLAAFAGVTLLDTHLAPRRPAWFTLASMGSWIVALLIGAFLIWMPERTFGYSAVGVTRFLSFLLIVLILQLAVLHVRLYSKAIDRSPSSFNRIVGYTTIGLVVVLAILLVLPLMLNEWIGFHDIYWRIVVAITILAAVGTALLPLVNALFAPKRPRPVAPRSAPSAPPLQAWPTYADGVTPLPMMPDGSPDWGAYYTGHPTPYPPQAAPQQHPQQQHSQQGAAITPSEPAVTQPAQPPAGYQGFPPPPPLPPR